ncbi:16995_t:CDS:2, partial [Racocetra fulgida]
MKIYNISRSRKMVSYALLLVVVISVKNSPSCSQGLAKYKLTRELSQTIKFKYFFPTNQPYQTFANGDIIFISGKYIVENSEPCFTIAYVSIVDNKNPNREFDMSDVPITIPIAYTLIYLLWCETVEYNSPNIKMDMTIIYPHKSPRFKYLGDLGSNIKLRSSYVISGLFKFSKSGKMMIEATDIDYLKTSTISINQSESLSSITANGSSIIDIIDDDIESIAIQKLQKPPGSYETSKNPLNTDIKIDQYCDRKKNHTTIDNYQSDEIQSDNENNDEKPINSVDDETFQKTEESEEE